VNIGPMEIVIVLVLALLVFGPKRLPQAGRSLGHAMREFKKATSTARSELGLDDIAADVRDVKSNLSIDLNAVDSSGHPARDAAAVGATVAAQSAATKAVPDDAERPGTPLGEVSDTLENGEVAGTPAGDDCA
jgi:sec-independent protein translocase protein TatA